MTSLGRLTALGRRLGVTAPGEELHADLRERYSEPHRAYHTLGHLAECLAGLDHHADLAAQPDEVELALWYHDAVYDPRAPDNEARSADLASERCSGLAHAAADRVRQLILATAHAAAPSEGDAALVVDLDLSILGAPAARFDAYERQIRREYAWVPEPRFRAGRARILEAFLSRPRIYTCAPVAKRLEAPARANLERSLAALRSS